MQSRAKWYQKDFGLKVSMKKLVLECQKSPIEILPFLPSPGMRSSHLQTILPTLLNQGGEEPPSAPFFIQLEDGDSLYCKMATPVAWKPDQLTILLLHGLTGSDSTGYMVRMSRKFYQAGYRSLRINLRGVGPGVQFAQRPYHGGVSQDILQLIQTLKKQTPDSPLILIGFSVSGNIILKLLGELGEKASHLIETAITICTPVDLAETTGLLFKNSNRIYQFYYVRELRRVGARWLGKNSIQSVIDYDNIVTAPIWGYQDAADYYRQCSSLSFLPEIRIPCHLILSEDDPFVNYQTAIQNSLSSHIKIWLSPYGGHMGFFGWAGKEHGYHWLDAFLLKLVNNYQ